MSDPNDSEKTSSSSSTPLAPLQPLQNPRYRHIARSAAKRESVQLLGSIKDLQLHFSRAGVEHRSGSGIGVRLGIDESEEDVLPTTSQPSRRGSVERRPWKEVELPRIGVDQVKREVGGILTRLRYLWDLTLPTSRTNGHISSPSMVSLINPSPTTPRREKKTVVVLIDTAKSTRRIRDLSLILALPEKNARKVSGGFSRIGRSSGFSTPSRPSGGNLPKISASGLRKVQHGQGVKDDEEDVFGQLRKSALEVLAGLRVLEESLRRDDPGGNGLSEGEMVDKSGSTSLGEGSIGLSRNLTDDPASGIEEEKDEWEEDYNFNTDPEETKHKQTWEERIMSEQREYNPLKDAQTQVDLVQHSVSRWIAVVESLFEVEHDLEELKSWARDDWTGKTWEDLVYPLPQMAKLIQEHTQSFLLAHLPLDLQPMIPPIDSSDWHETLLSRLSDGYLLTQAYNSAIASSPKPWGYIPLEDVHETLPSSSDQQDQEPRLDKEWTFRRIENLTCWAAALKLRYNLPIQIPTSHLNIPIPLPGKGVKSSQVSTPRPSLPPITSDHGVKKRESMPKLEFDPSVIARRGPGWQAMLNSVLERWVEEAVREARLAEGEEAGL